MAIIKLTTKRVEKPWGRLKLWPSFGDVGPGGQPVGEIWFEMPDGSEPDLLVKYLFTSEKLSIQVHPDDAAARAKGYPRGKDEAWVILDAEPDATIAIGTRTVMTREELKSYVLDGSIEDRLSWKSVKAGDAFYSPAGTVHAIGAGLTLVEVQQNIDLTYRLWDYGRPRELHLEEGVAVANPVPYVAPHVPCTLEEGRTVLCDGPKFVLERWKRTGRGALDPAGRRLWLVPLIGAADAGGEEIKAGEVAVIDAETQLSLSSDADLLVAYQGEEVIQAIWRTA